MLRETLKKYVQIDLDAVFNEFYQTMLSNSDFSGFFRDDSQIKDLIVRQKKFLLDSVSLDDAEIKRRYTDLGEMHYDIKIPYIDYMAGMNILEKGIIRTISNAGREDELLDFTFHFFHKIRAFTAKGYLNKMLVDDIDDIDLYLTHVSRASELDTMLATERVIWLKNVLFAIQVENRNAAPALSMPREVSNAITSIASSDPVLLKYTTDIATRMETNARNVFFFLDKGSYEEVLPLYRELLSIYKLTLMLTSVVTIASSNALVANLTKDKLTGLLTRHTYDSIMKRESIMAHAGQYELSFIMVDIDHFKLCNDNYGHPFGDHVLSKIGEVLSTTIRATDFAFRVGGEEFLLVLKGASKPIALAQAETMRKTIENSTFKFKNDDIKLTASFGVTTYMPPINLSPSEILDHTDKKLYEAKNNGRNQVC